MNIVDLKKMLSAVNKSNANGSNFSMYAEIANSIAHGGAIELLNNVVESKEILGGLDLLSEDHVYMYREGEFNLLLRFLGGSKSESLYCNEYDAFIINSSDEMLRIPCYSSNLDRFNLYARPAPLLSCEPIIINPKSVFFLEAYTYILDFSQSKPHNSFVFVIHSDRRDWVTWLYDRSTLLPSQPICTDLTASRMQLYIRFLGEAKAIEATKKLEALACSDYAGFVRWEAVEAIAKLAPDRLESVLIYLSDNDKDFRVRDAALKSLKTSATSRG